MRILVTDCAWLLFFRPIQYRTMKLTTCSGSNPLHRPLRDRQERQSKMCEQSIEPHHCWKTIVFYHLALDRSILPPCQYREAGFDRHQVFDIDISRIVTEYRAEMLVDKNGQRFVASFPGL